jgi:glycosyltransferase involved in cell wall biosynthesis
MHVWLIQTGEPLPGDEGGPRLLRTGLLAEELSRRGHRVTWWASTFRHATKRFRAQADTAIDVQPGYRLLLLHSPGYATNVSLRRFIDHRIVGRGFRAWARREERPDVIHCAFPAIELAYEASEYAHERHVPWVLDARDMWPDIYVEAFHPLLRGVARLALGPDFRMTARAFQRATAITGHAPGFVEWGLRQAGRQRGPLDVDVPFAYPSAVPDEAALAQARAQWQALGVGVDDGEFNICFFGTFAERDEVDLATVVAAARELATRVPNVRFILCGTGPSEARIRELARGLGNVLLPGWVGATGIWSLMRLSRMGLLPYLPSRDFALSIPNKVVEYLSAGLPILTCLQGGYLQEVLSEGGCGRFYGGGDRSSLVAAVIEAVRDPVQLEREHHAAERLFARRFAAAIVNEQLIEHLQRVRATT